MNIFWATVQYVSTTTETLKCKKNATLPLVHFNVNFRWDPPACSSGGGEWWEIICHTHTHTHEQSRAELSCLDLDAGILGFCSSQHGNTAGELNGTTMVHVSAAESLAAGRVRDWGSWSLWHSLASWCRAHCSGPRRRAAILWEDVEPIYEWKHQESWAGIQLHCQAAGRYGIYVHHSG